METPKKEQALDGGLIYRLMPKIMADIEPIGKDRKNDQQHYSFRGIDDVYNFVQPILAKHGVFMLPKIVDLQRSERPSKSGGTMTFVQARVQYQIVASDGSSVTAEAAGEGMDAGDKALPKALSGAQKYAILQIFCIPTSDPKDSENDSPEPRAVEPPARPAPKPSPAPAAHSAAGVSTAKEQQDRIQVMLTDLARGDEVEAKAILKRISFFIGQEGDERFIEDIYKLNPEKSAKWIGSLYGKIKREHEADTALRNGPDAF